MPQVPKDRMTLTGARSITGVHPLETRLRTRIHSTTMPESVLGAMPIRKQPPYTDFASRDAVAKLRLDGTPTPRSRVARVTKRPTPTGVWQERLRAGGSAIGVVHAER